MQLRNLNLKTGCPKCDSFGLVVTETIGYQETSCLYCGWTEYGDHVDLPTAQSSLAGIPRIQAETNYTLWNEKRGSKSNAERLLAERNS